MPNEIFILSHGGCAKRPIAYAFLTVGQIPISGPVGLNGTNRPKDVMAIQENLNKIRPAGGGPLEPLAVDGIVGPKTLGAIRRYQNQVLGWSDLRVDPGGATIRQLTLDADPENALDEKLVTLILEMVPRARILIEAARASLLLAPLGDSAGPRRARQLLEKHFELGKFPKPDLEFLWINQTFRLMHEVLARVYEKDPRTQWTGLFVPNTSPIEDVRAAAYTYGGGYYALGKTLSNERIPFRHRKDRIYICRPMALEAREWQAMSIVHELAHYVGPDSDNPNHITDFAYGPTKDPQMQKLQPWHRTHNAQSFANFAYEAATGSELIW